MASTFDEDNYSAEEIEELSDFGEMGYCELNNHYDWAENVHGWGRLDDLDKSLGACDDCEGELPSRLVDAALNCGLRHVEVRRRLEVQIEAGSFDPETANKIAGVLAARWIEA